MSQYETGAREPTLRDIEKIAKILGVSFAYLATGTETFLTSDELNLLDDYRDNLEVNRNALRVIARSGRLARNFKAKVSGEDWVNSDIFQK